MLNRLSRITQNMQLNTPHRQFNRTFGKLAVRSDNSHFSARRIGGRMLMMWGLTAMYLPGNKAVIQNLAQISEISPGIGQAATQTMQFIGDVAKNLTYFPLAIWGLLKKPYQVATIIGLAVGFTPLADTIAPYLSSFLFKQQYEFIPFDYAVLISCGLETARVIWNSVVWNNIYPKEHLESSLAEQLQDNTISSQNIADRMLKLGSRRGNLIFCHSIIRSLMDAENMSWKAAAVIQRLEEQAQQAPSFVCRKTQRAKQILRYHENKVKFLPQSYDIYV